MQASRESIVLLKNAGELLPLDINSTKKIAVCGPNANEEGYALTHYGPLAVEVTTVLEGIQEKTKARQRCSTPKAATWWTPTGPKVKS